MVAGPGRDQIREEFLGHWEGTREIEDLRESKSQEGLPGGGVT